MNDQATAPPVARLYPEPQTGLSLQGLYLEHGLHTLGRDTPYVYSNFITSLDGRIALGKSGRTTHTVPEAITNPRDWRLYQELAGQADILVTSGRFFRQSSAGEAQDVLPVGTQQEFADIRSWRSAQGLQAQPDIAIMSGSLDIPLAALEPYRSRRLIVVTGDGADESKVRRLLDNDVTVMRAGSGRRVDGRLMVEQLATAGYRSVYAIAGPAVFGTLLQARTVNRLYLTLACTLLGGYVFDTLTRGELLVPAQGMQLGSLYHDGHAPAGAGQLFAMFESGTG
ncbi:MAG: dihydrofolate reductase family protein [Pseudomonadota bacterium]